MATSTIKSYNVIDWKVVTITCTYVSNTQQSIDLNGTEEGYVAVGVVGSWFTNGTSGSGYTYCFFQNHYVEDGILYYRTYALNGTPSKVEVYINVLFIKEGQT